MAVLHLVLMFAAPFTVSALVAIALSSLVAWRSARFAHTAADATIRGEPRRQKRSRAIALAFELHLRSSKSDAHRIGPCDARDQDKRRRGRARGSVRDQARITRGLDARKADRRRPRRRDDARSRRSRRRNGPHRRSRRKRDRLSRESHTTKLEPLSSGASITLRSEARPRARIEGLARRLAVVFPALPFFWLPLGAIQDWSNVDTTKCAELGTCHAIPIWRTDAPFLTVVKGWWHGDHYKSGPSSDANCAATTACSQYGQCHAVDGQCQAKGDGDCQASWQCMQYGNCSDNAGRCAALKDEDCARTEMCWNFGACTADASRGCTIGKDSDCARTEQCTKWGQCSAVNHDCKAVKDSDCRQGEVCRDGPRCTASDGECVATDASCHETYDCMTSGGCATSGGTSAFCVPKTDDDCQWSRACIEYGECTAYQRICAIDTLRCSEARSVSLKETVAGTNLTASRGAIGIAKHRSVAKSTAHASSSTVGAERAAPIRIDCKLDGRCTFDNNRCVVGGDADCSAVARLRARRFCARADRTAGASRRATKIASRRTTAAKSATALRRTDAARARATPTAVFRTDAAI